MAKRKKSKPAAPPAPITAADSSTEIRVEKRENPYFNPAFAGRADNPKEIEVTINVKESAIETLFARGELTPLQRKAAECFRSRYEIFARGSVQAIDYSQEQVDGASSAMQLSERRARARKDLYQVKMRVGDRSYKLLVSICAHGYSLGAIYPGEIFKRMRLTAADNLRSALDDVAIVWSLTGRGIEAARIRAIKAGQATEAA